MLGEATPGPRPLLSRHLLYLPPVATGRPGHRQLACEGLLSVRARRWSTSGSSWHPRGWGPQSRPRAGLSGTQRSQLQVRTLRREPCQAGGARSRDSRSGTSASGGNQGAGSRSRARCPLRARGAHPAVLCPPQGSPGYPQSHRRSGRIRPSSLVRFQRTGRAPAPAHISAVTGRAETHPTLVPSCEPKWTSGSASFQPLHPSLCLRKRGLRELLSPKG